MYCHGQETRFFRSESQDALLQKLENNTDLKQCRVNPTAVGILLTSLLFLANQSPEQVVLLSKQVCNSSWHKKDKVQ